MEPLGRCPLRCKPSSSRGACCCRCRMKSTASNKARKGGTSNTNRCTRENNIRVGENFNERNMAVSATSPVLSPSSTPSAGALFRPDPLYSSSTESSNMISVFLTSGGCGRTSNNGTAGTTSNSSHNECKMVDVHGVKVASFTIDGQDLICLPQVFDLFLKHLVGGLHTVYTKLKRLDISAVVCTVEQVRVLRGLGAIQPGVNRCKLISRKDFEALYNDCTNASSMIKKETLTPCHSLANRHLPVQ